MAEQKKIEKSKHSKEEVSNSKKPKYEAPSVMKLGELTRGSGDCVNGSMVTDYCSTGPTVAPGCNNGGTPIAVCSTGGTPNT